MSHSYHDRMDRIPDEWLQDFNRRMGEEPSSQVNLRLASAGTYSIPPGSRIDCRGGVSTVRLPSR